MAQPEVNIAIPTFNRPSLLRETLDSALMQDYPRLRITIYDNASTDETPAVIDSYADKRITGVRHETNIGLFRNFNYSIAQNTSPYLLILQDDDLIDSRFISRSVEMLERYPDAAISFTDSTFIDGDGVIVGAQQQDDYFSPGLVDGRDYLQRIVAGENLVIHVSSVVMRADAVRETGPFDAMHARTSIDFNLYFRLAADHDLVYVPECLASIRRHEGADHLHSEVDTRPLAMLAERSDAAAFLLESARAEDPTFRRWLAERLLHLSMRRSELTARLVPDTNLSYADKQAALADHLRELMPDRAHVILIDEAEFGAELLPNCRVRPFIEKDGQYWGPPDDSALAIRELERMCGEGSRYLVIAWPAFWWFDFYVAFREYLYANGRCICADSRAIVFELTG